MKYITKTHTIKRIKWKKHTHTYNYKYADRYIAI